MCPACANWSTASPRGTEPLAADRLALVIRHTPDEGLAGFRAPIEAAGYEIRLLATGDLAALGPEVYSADLLVTMGGPMGVYERDAHPWIADELAILSERIGDGGPTLGVCLGAQMVAAAMGARVYPGPVKEVGFKPVDVLDAGLASPLRHLAGVPVLHWHGDTFDVPDGVEVLARTDPYVQAFRRGDHLLALQCHPEMGEDARIESWMRDAAYLAQAETTAAKVRADNAALGSGAVAAGRALLTEWLARLEG